MTGERQGIPDVADDLPEVEQLGPVGAGRGSLLQDGGRVDQQLGGGDPFADRLRLPPGPIRVRPMVDRQLAGLLPLLRLGGGPTGQPATPPLESRPDGHRDPASRSAPGSVFHRCLRVSP